MSRFSEKAIEEANRENEKQFEIDYECVQFGKWITDSDYVCTSDSWFNPFIRQHNFYTTEELYQLYKNDKQIK